MKTIKRQLLIYLLGGMLITTLIAVAATYAKIRQEANELFDYQLKQIVAALPDEIPADLVLPQDNDEDEQITVQVWNKNGVLVFASGPAQALPRSQSFGYKSISFGGEKWRIYTEGNSARVIQASQLKRERNELAANMALGALMPFLIMMPLLALLIWLTVERGLAPLHRMAKDVAKRSPNALIPLPGDHYPLELQPILYALNGLLTQLSDAITIQKAFIADAAHELRTPLTALKLQLQLIERERIDLQESADFKKLHDRLNRAIHLVTQLLVSARQERYLADASRQPLDLMTLVASVISDHVVQAENKNIDLGLLPLAAASSTPMLINGNKSSLRIMLNNLIDNAIRYTPAGGHIDISVSQDPTSALFLLSVADDGPGIPEDDHQRVFDRFYRRDGHDTSGSGLGLFIVKSILDQHQASIRLSAAGENGGLKVTVGFPPLPTVSESSLN